MYVLSDVQGSSRAVMNNNGVGTSAIIARHDYLPFGEEIGSGIGLRSGGQSYGASDNNRKKYGLTERDNVTGLDHTWFRKYESLSGRWTSPDPLAGNIANPQSFNRYSYVNNDPLNFVDPTGLECYNVTLTDGQVVRICPEEAVQIYANYGLDDPFFTGQFNPDMRMAALIFGNPEGPVVSPGIVPTPIPQRPAQEIAADKRKACFEDKKILIDAARETFRAGAGKRILKHAAFGTARGAIAGGIGGGAAGGAFFGVGAVPGAILGVIVGGIFGAAAGVITGGLFVEPVRRFLYNNNTYKGALEQAKKYCDAQY